MYMNRFWSSVWGVALFLMAVGLLQYVVYRIAVLFGLLAAVAPLMWKVVAAVVPLVGALTYIDWRWAWKPEHVGLVRTRSAALWLVPGLFFGALAALLAYALSAFLSGSLLTVPGISSLSVGALLGVAGTMVIAFNTELIFRGVVISRYQADLSHRELLLAATLTPFGWMLVQALFGFGAPPTGIDSLYMAAMSVFLSLLFLRTDSVWLSAGLHAGMVGTAGLLNLRITEAGGLAVWGTAAAILLALDWIRYQGMPRPLQRGRTGRRTVRGRTIRGPWGPH